MSALEGTVIDAKTRQPIAGVSVTATLQSGQTVDTDAAGNYYLGNLQPGTYTLQLAMDGYYPYTRDGIDLQINRTIRINAELLPTSLGAAANS